jgi:hypothetical protein
MTKRNGHDALPSVSNRPYHTKGKAESACGTLPCLLKNGCAGLCAYESGRWDSDVRRPLLKAA